MKKGEVFPVFVSVLSIPSVSLGDRGNKLMECRSIGGTPLKKNDLRRSLLIGENLVSFTPTEYRLLQPLLETAIVEDHVLTMSVFGCRPDEHLMRTLKKHIENTKSKLKSAGLTVRRIHQYGYSLVAMPIGHH